MIPEASPGQFAVSQCPSSYFFIFRTGGPGSDGIFFVNRVVTVLSKHERFG